MKKLRSQIPEKYKWDLSLYFSSDEEWKEEFEKLKKEAEVLYTFRGKLNNENDIIGCLTLENQLDERMEVLYVYAALKVREDAANAAAKERLGILGQFLSGNSAKCSFIDTEIKELPDHELLRLKQKKFPLYFDEVIRQKKHILSEKEEKILSGMSEFSGTFSENFDMLDDVDMVFGKVKNGKGKLVELNHANYMPFMESDDRVLRQNALKMFNASYGKLNNLLCSNYLGNVKRNAFLAKTRGFAGSLEKSIFSEQASAEVYAALLKGVGKALPLFHRCFKLKAKMLGLSDFSLHDVWAKKTKLSQKISYDEAFCLVRQAVAPLGEEYQKLLDRAKAERWIDVYPNKGKDTGAFSWGAYGKNPVVLTNFVEDIHSTFTLAHELGHCLHSYHSDAALPYEEASYTIFVAEVASNVNELLLWNMLKNKAKTKEEKLYFLDYVCGQFRGSIHRQTMFAEFEDFVHKTYEAEQPLSTKVLNEFYFDLNKRYFGESVILPEEIQFEWSRIPHFYRSFYVYKYATGLISALVLASNIQKHNGAENYLRFLSSGRTKPPVEQLKDAGVDLTKSETFETAFAFFEEILDEMEKELK